MEGHYRDELLYELNDCYELMNIYEQRIGGCDVQIEQILSEVQAVVQQPQQEQSQAAPASTEPTATSTATAVLAKKQSKGKHSCTADIRQHCYRMLGTDIFSIPGIGPGVALTFMSEMGEGIFKFSTVKQFASYLSLTPNNRISGGARC